MNNKTNIIITKDDRIIEWLKSQGIKGNEYEKFDKDIINDIDNGAFVFGNFSIEEVMKIQYKHDVIHIIHPKNKNKLKKYEKNDELTPEEMDNLGFKLKKLNISFSNYIHDYSEDEGELNDNSEINENDRKIASFEEIEFNQNKLKFLYETFRNLSCCIDNNLLKKYDHILLDKEDLTIYKSQIDNSPSYINEKRMLMIIEFLIQLWEHQIYEIFYKLDDYDYDDVNFNNVKDIMKDNGYDIEKFCSWKYINELRHYVNVIKHSSGKSLKKLKDSNELFFVENNLNKISPLSTPFASRNLKDNYYTIEKIFNKLNDFWIEFTNKMEEKGNIFYEDDNDEDYEEKKRELDEEYLKTKEDNYNLYSKIIDFLIIENSTHIFIKKEDLDILEDRCEIKVSKPEDILILKQLNNKEFIINVCTTEFPIPEKTMQCNEITINKIKENNEHICIMNLIN